MMIDPGILFAVIFLGALISTFSFIVYWHILHYFLCKEYDDLLFKEPIFNQTELAVYSAWPLSLVRSMGYALLVAMPRFYITKKRFKNLEIDRTNNYLLTLFCKGFLILCALDILFVLAMIIMGIFSYLPGAGQSN